MSLTSFLSILSLVLSVSGANYRRVTCPDGVHTATNEACCVFHSLADELQAKVFNFTCFEQVHRAVRLAFQDAISFSFEQGPSVGGGADGSIIVFPVELEDPANTGIDVAINDIAFLLESFDVSAADLIQFSAAVGATNCPGYPQLQFQAGRPNATRAATPGLIPEPQDAVNDIFARMGDAGFNPTELVSLLAAHSTGHTNFLVNNRIQVPFDTTPFKFDTQYYLEVLLHGNETLPPASAQAAAAQVQNALALGGELRLQSDFAVAHSPQSACFWQFMVNNQAAIQQGFHDAMAKVAVIGQDTSKLIDCSEAVPMPVVFVSEPATFPAGTGPELLDLTCDSPFPSLSTDPGFPTTIPLCPDGGIECLCPT